MDRSSSTRSFVCSLTPAFMRFAFARPNLGVALNAWGAVRRSPHMDRLEISFGKKQCELLHTAIFSAVLPVVSSRAGFFE
jgi:hypothetical protein